MRHAPEGGPASLGRVRRQAAQQATQLRNTGLYAAQAPNCARHRCDAQSEWETFAVRVLTRMPVTAGGRHGALPSPRPRAGSAHTPLLASQSPHTAVIRFWQPVDTPPTPTAAACFGCCALISVDGLAASTANAPSASAASLSACATDVGINISFSPGLCWHQRQLRLAQSMCRRPRATQPSS